MAIATIELIIPDLFAPLRQWEKAQAFMPNAPYLMLLLQQYQRLSSGTQQGLEATVFQSLGYFKTGETELPSAYYRAQTHSSALTEKILKTGGGVFANQWKKPSKMLLCADPVHLEVGMNEITLTDKVVDLTQQEVEDSIEALNAHFSQDGICFYWGSTHQWYVELPVDAKLNTTPVADVVGHNIASFMPHSATRNWQMIHNEAQMILHALPHAAERERKGQLTANSLWFWGGGRAFAPQPPVDHVYGFSETLTKTIAAAAQCPSTVLSLTTPLTMDSNASHALIILDSLSESVKRNDTDSYQDKLHAIDSHIIQPILQAWQKKTLEVRINTGDGNLIVPTTRPAWKIWASKNTSLTHIARQLST